MTRIGWPGAAFSAAAIVLAFGAAVPVALAADARVTIRDFAFRPAVAIVRVGDTVSWTNRDAVAHTVKWSAGQPESPPIGTGASYSRTFTRTGTYPYVCGPHPFMSGTVRVVAATGPPAPGGAGSGGGATPGTDTIGGPIAGPAWPLSLLLFASGLGGALLMRLRLRTSTRENRGPDQRRREMTEGSR